VHTHADEPERAAGRFWVTPPGLDARRPEVLYPRQDRSVSLGEELVEQRRRRRRAGDFRLSEADREFLGRVVDGDLAKQFQAALDAASDTDPLLGADPGEGN
jgi:hypothetical protein